jgi:hypothetical protein
MFLNCSTAFGDLTIGPQRGLTTSFLTQTTERDVNQLTQCATREGQKNVGCAHSHRRVWLTNFRKLLWLWLHPETEPRPNLNPCCGHNGSLGPVDGRESWLTK